jgi:hypothetical protein
VGPGPGKDSLTWKLFASEQEEISRIIGSGLWIPDSRSLVAILQFEAFHFKCFGDYGSRYRPEPVELVS